MLHRLLQEPSEKIAKFFLMDGDVEEIRVMYVYPHFL